MPPIAVTLVRALCDGSWHCERSAGADGGLRVLRESAQAGALQDVRYASGYLGGYPSQAWLLETLA